MHVLPWAVALDAYLGEVPLSRFMCHSAVTVRDVLARYEVGETVGVGGASFA